MQLCTHFLNVIHCYYVFHSTARPGWQTISFRQPIYKSKLTKIEVNLVDVLKIDVERQEVTVEPMVTMGQLTATLIPLGWTIPVLPELDDLTVGKLNLANRLRVVHGSNETITL